jgi:hypothetical protein
MPKITVRIVYGCFLLSLLLYSTIRSFKKANELEEQVASSVKTGAMLVLALFGPFILYTTFN